MATCLAKAARLRPSEVPTASVEKVPEHRPMARRTSLSRLDLFEAHLLMMMFCAREVSIVHEESDLPADPLQAATLLQSGRSQAHRSAGLSGDSDNLWHYHRTSSSG